MYSQTKSYLKNSLLKLIAQTDDTEHKGGRVTIEDIRIIVDELNTNGRREENKGQENGD